MADRIDGMGNRLNFTLGEFQQARDTELFQHQKVPPRGLSEWVGRTRETEFLQLSGKLHLKALKRIGKAPKGPSNRLMKKSFSAGCSKMPPAMGGTRRPKS